MRKPRVSPPETPRASKTRVVGRPSKYEPRYCEEIIAFCRGGYSITAFAGSIGVARDTISEWATQHAEFSAAVKMAKAAATLAYEEAAARVRAKGGGPGTATMIIFGLKNMAPDDWREKSEVEHGVTNDLADLMKEIDGRTRGIPSSG